MEFPNYMVVLFFNFLGTFMMFSMMDVQIDLPTNSIEELPLLHIVASIFYLLSFNKRHPNRCEMISHQGFNVLLLTKATETQSSRNTI